MRVMHLIAELNGEKWDLGIATNDIDSFETQAGRLGRDMRLDAVWGRDETRRTKHKKRTDGSSTYYKTAPKLLWRKKRSSRQAREERKDPANFIAEVSRRPGPHAQYRWIVNVDGEIKTGQAATEELAWAIVRHLEQRRPIDDPEIAAILGIDA